MNIKYRLVRATLEEMKRQEFATPLFRGFYFADNDGDRKSWISGEIIAEVPSRTKNKLCINIRLDEIRELSHFAIFCDERKPLDYTTISRIPLKKAGDCQEVCVKNLHGDSILKLICDSGQNYDVTSLDIDANREALEILRKYRENGKNGKRYEESTLIKDILFLWTSPQLNRSKKQSKPRLYFS